MLITGVRTSSLGARGIIWISLVLTVILSAITMMNTEQQTKMMLIKEKEAAFSISKAIIIAMRHPMFQGDQKTIQLQFNYFSRLKGLEEIILTDHDGVIRRSSNKKLLNKTSEEMKSYLSYFKSHKGDVHKIETSATSKRRVFTDVMVIRNESKCFACHGSSKKVLGILKISLDWESVLARINSIKNRNIAMSLFGILTIGALSIAFLLRAVVNPIHKLEKGMRKVASGDLDCKVVNKTNDEIGSLTRIFNSMTLNLKNLMQREKELTSAKQKQAEKLAESLSLINATLQSTADGILVLDENKRVINFNQKFVDMWEIPQEVMSSSVEGAVIAAMLAKIETVEGFDKIKYLYADEHQFSVIKLTNGRILERYLQPQNLKGKVVGGVWSFRDINERKKAEKELQEKKEELERSNADLQQFAYVSSHDLQEPLRMVAGYVKLLDQRYRNKLDADADEFISYAINGAHRMSELINDLLTYSRVNTQGTELKPIDTNKPFKKALFNLQTLIRENKAVIEHDPLPEVMGDETQLMQLFQNLIGNAIKFKNKEQVRIYIGVKKEEDKWILFVSDNGIGIKEEYFKRIFMVFQRLHSRAEYSGTGIGLSLCKRIVERHEGQLWVESKPGEGTTFYFSLKPVGGEQG